MRLMSSIDTGGDVLNLDLTDLVSFDLFVNGIKEHFGNVMGFDIG